MKTPAVVSSLVLLASATASGMLAAVTGHTPAFSGCVGAGQAVRPHRILFACADGNFYVDHLRWSSWAARSASGLGVGHQNDCMPYCAAGHFHAYPRVSIRLGRPETCTRSRRLFTRITYRFLGRKPPSEKYRQSTLKAPFLFRSGCP
jgi:hypothetical protein